MMPVLLKEPLVRSALVTSAFLALLRLGGAQARVGVLSGTLVDGRVGLFFGLLWALSFFAVVTLVPPLLVAGLLSAWSARRSAARR